MSDDQFLIFLLPQRYGVPFLAVARAEQWFELVIADEVEILLPAENRGTMT